MGVKRRRGRRRKKLLDDLKDRRGYCHLKEEALDRTMWRNHFGGGFGPVVRQNIEWMDEFEVHPWTGPNKEEEARWYHKKNLIIWYSSVSITTRPHGLKTGVRTVVLYLHFLTCMDGKSGTFGYNDNPTHNCEWTTLKREEVTERLGKTYKVSVKLFWPCIIV